MKTKKLLVAFIATILVANSFGQTFDKAKLDQLFDRLNEKNKAMGSLLLVKEGNILYTRTFGYSQINGAEKKPLTAASRYRIGSVTKMFTGTMIFQLVQEGKLSLDDNLAKYFPQIPNAEKITILHLLGHRSGIHDLADGLGKHNPRTQHQLLATMVKGGSNFEPGSKYEYSNSGYVVLGWIIEKIDGKPYAQCLQERIASPTGLNDTYLGTGLTDISKNESHSYSYYGNWQQEVESHLSIAGGAGSIISTPADLVKFIQALFGLKLVSKSSLDQMMQKSLGMEPFTYNEKTYYGHAGGIDNFGTWLVYQPEEKLALAYASNAKIYPVKDIIDGVFNIYANKPYAIPTFETLAVSPEILDKYVGV